LARYPACDNFIIAVILFNAVILGLETSETAMAAAGGLILTLDRICLAIFVANWPLKLYARGGGSSGRAGTSLTS
jgi:voltage-gated sodium channel